MQEAQAFPLIVVADDDPLILDLVSRFLGREGDTIIGCSSEEHAYQTITQELPNLVILDMHMERRDSALNVISLMRSNPTTMIIPAIICSSDWSFLYERKKEIEAHQCDIIEKPFDFSKLLAKIQAAIGPTS